VQQTFPVGPIIDQLLLIWSASEQEEWANQVVFLGRVSYLLMEEKMAIVEPQGGTADGRGSRKVSALSE
jgi:hypothetical protein